MTFSVAVGFVNDGGPIPPFMSPRRQNDEDIGGKWPPQIVVLSVRPFRFDTEAILTSHGFDRFCPLLRWQALT